jgi:hypothetical protein
MALVSGLYTEVKNTSGQTRVFGFLGLRGRRLANNETFSVPGDLVADVARNRRKFQALERALHDGDLVINKSPEVYLTDVEDDDEEEPTEDDDEPGGDDDEPGGDEPSGDD